MRWSEQRRATMVMGLLTLLWGYSWIIAKLALSQAGPFAFAALRVLVGVVAIGAFLFITGHRPSRRPPRGAVAVGLVQTAAFLILNTWALSGGGAGKTAILTFTMPFWVLLFAWPVLAERVVGVQWLAIGCALGGLFSILEPWQLHASVLSECLAVLAGMMWATGVVLTKRVQREAASDALDFTFWQMAIGLMPMLLVAATVPERPIAWTPLFVLAVMFSGVVSTALGWLMWQYVLTRLPAGTTSLASLAVPVVATVTGALQLGERLRPAEITGAALIAVALALMSWQSVRSHHRDDLSMAQE